MFPREYKKQFTATEVNPYNIRLKLEKSDQEYIIVADPGTAGWVLRKNFPGPLMDCLKGTFTSTQEAAKALYMYRTRLSDADKQIKAKQETEQKKESK